MDIEQLVTAGKGGNLAAQNRLARWLCAMLDRYLAAQFPHEADLQDLRQQTCMVVFKDLHEFEDRGPGSFGRWARGIARLRVQQKWQAGIREAARLRKLAHQPRESSLSLTAKVTLRELEQQLGAAFARLSKLERDAIRWDRESWNDEELAVLWDVTSGNICTHRHRGYQRLATQTRKMRKTPLPRVVLTTESSSSLQKI